MGLKLSIEIASSDMSLRDKVITHLRTNFHPPVEVEFIPVAIEAIEKANEGDWDFLQLYPNGLVKEVTHTVQGLHLEPYLEDTNE